MSNVKNARFINVETKEYPIYFSDIRSQLKQVSFPANPSAELLAEYGFAIVVDGVYPEGVGQVSEIEPTLIDNVSTKQYELTPPTESELEQRFISKQAELKGRVINALRNALEAGYTFVSSEGDLSVQIRDSDRLTLLTLREEARGLESDEQTILFRTTDNVNVSVKKQDMISLTNDALAHHSLLAEASWALKDKIAAAKDESELPAVPAIITA